MKIKEIIIIGSILLVSSLSWLAVELTKKPGSGVIVKINGVEVADYSLSIDGVYELNGGTNILVIEDGYAYMKEASCPGKDCTRERKISRTGERIVCTYYKLTAVVEGKDEEIFIN